MDEPLGIALEGWPYPAPVHLFDLVVRDEPVRMAYMDLAPDPAAHGRVVVLLHGKNFDSSYWGGTAVALVRAGYRVVVPDQIGFNKSAKPAVTYTFAMLADNTLALADHLGIDTFDLLGHSTGGGLAIALAHTAPARVRRLVLEDPVGIVAYRDHIPEPSLEALLTTERSYTTESYRAFVGHFFPHEAAERYESFVTWRMRVARSPEFERFALASALTYLMIYRRPLRADLEALRMPILLTAGSDDRSTPMIMYAAPDVRPRIPSIPQVAEEIAAARPNVDLRRYPGVGHVPHLADPARFDAELVGFLDGYEDM